MADTINTNHEQNARNALEDFIANPNAKTMSLLSAYAAMLVSWDAMFEDEVRRWEDILTWRYRVFGDYCKPALTKEHIDVFMAHISPMQAGCRADGFKRDATIKIAMRVFEVTEEELKPFIK